MRDEGLGDFRRLPLLNELIRTWMPNTMKDGISNLTVMGARELTCLRFLTLYLHSADQIRAHEELATAAELFDFSHECWCVLHHTGRCLRKQIVLRIENGTPAEFGAVGVI